MPWGNLLPPLDGIPDSRPKWLKFLRLDWIGTFLCVGFITTFAVGCEFAGVTKKWSDTSVIVVSDYDMLIKGQWWIRDDI